MRSLRKYITQLSKKGCDINIISECSREHVITALRSTKIYECEGRIIRVSSYKRNTSKDPTCVIEVFVSGTTLVFYRDGLRIMLFEGGIFLRAY